MRGPRVRIFERSDPLVTFRLRKKNPFPTGGTTPYSLAGSPTIDLYVKNSPDDADGSAAFHYTSAQITVTLDGSTGDYSELTIQFANTDLPTPKNQFYYLSVTKGGRKEVVASGILEIQNV